MKRLSLIVITLMLGACAGQPTQERPAWIDDPAAQHPAAAYLTAVGVADDTARAQDRAYANLAKIFEASIQEVSHDLREIQHSNDERGPRLRDELHVSRALQVGTDVALQGVRIAAHWQDPQTGRHHALAVLARAPAAATLRQDIQRLDSATDALMGEGAETLDALARARVLQRAIALQTTRAAEQRLLGVIDVSGRGVPGTWNLYKLHQQRDQVLAGIRIVVHTAQGAHDLQSLVAGAVARAGFKAVDAGPYRLDAQLSSQDVGLHEGWYWMRGRLNVTLATSSGLRTLGTHNWPLKAAAADKDTAEQRLLEEARKALDRDLRALILGARESNDTKTH